MRDALIDPQPGDLVRSTPHERKVIKRDGDTVVFKYLYERRERTVTLYEWQQAMVRCKYRVAP